MHRYWGHAIEYAAHFTPLERNDATAGPLLDFLAAHPIEDAAAAIASS